MNPRRFITLLALFVVLCGCCQPLRAAAFEIIVNHLGYDTRGAKRLVVQSGEEMDLARFEVLDSEGHVAFEGPLQEVGPVDGWKGRFFHQGDFSALGRAGAYRIQVKDARSEPFALRGQLLPEACLSDLVYYFRIQRCSGVYDKADHAIPFFGEPERKRVDVHGGWFDASGDVSKYLGYLTEANHMVPQGSPMAVWCFLQAVDLLGTHPGQRLRSVLPLLREEALYGADFLHRMQDPEGYFYLSVMDGSTKDPGLREICGYEGLDHVKHGRTKAAFREGGGIAIAALARTSTLKRAGDYSSAQYLAAAE